MPVTPDPRIPLLKELAEPIRLRVIDRLGHRGPATVTELSGELGVAMPKLSNHLKRLREAGLVQVTRSGRHAIYALSDPSLQSLLPLLDRLTGRALAAAGQAPSATTRSRRCYDHLAGRVGVDLYAALLERGALVDHPDGTVALGPQAEATLASLGVRTGALEPTRRRFAFEVSDSLAHAPHRAGALGGAVAEALTARGWIERGDGRDLLVTPAGRRGLRRTLGLALGSAR